MITKKFQGLQFKLAITNIDNARIGNEFVNDTTLEAIYKINKEKPINNTYTQAIPQVILAMNTFLQFYYFVLILTGGNINPQKTKAYTLYFK